MLLQPSLPLLQQTLQTEIAFLEDQMLVVKTILREILKLFQLHIPLLNIALAQRRTIIRGHLPAPQQQQQPLIHQLSTAQAQKHITIRCLLCVQQQPQPQPQQPLSHLHSIAQAQKPIIIRGPLFALHPHTQVQCIAKALIPIIIQCHSYAQAPTQQHSIAQAADPTIILYHLSALFRLLLHLALLPTLPLSIAVPPGLLTTPGHIIALTL